MKIEDFIVSAESVRTGKRLVGYVCGCKSCRTAYPDEEYDHSRPIGLLTHPEEDYGNVRVYTDTIELIGDIYGKKIMLPRGKSSYYMHSEEIANAMGQILDNIETRNTRIKYLEEENKKLKDEFFEDIRNRLNEV